MAYFDVFRASGEHIGSVQANNAEEAVYRLVGGEWGRKDFYAKPKDDA